MNQITWKAVGKIALNTATAICGLYAGGFWFGWGFKAGCREHEMIEELGRIRANKKRLDKIQKDLDELRGKEAWDEEDTNKLVACYRGLVDILGPNDPMVIQLNEEILSILNAEDGGEEVQE